MSENFAASAAAEPDPLPEEEVFAVLGEEGFGKFVGIFYREMRKDDLIGPMYPQDDWDLSLIHI